ncbi:hypothetical protein FWK35_00012088 [Aphis craccivora]|uniref:Uncharacterized protein n=1 Tax=Aphis craccivora TaxID=307492 RepID=A0A6G0YLL4_APHCR|nr:hypothetical protein FWK35_00012088 [Aphis craccivora]
MRLCSEILCSYAVVDSHHLERVQRRSLYHPQLLCSKYTILLMTSHQYCANLALLPSLTGVFKT